MNPIGSVLRAARKARKLTQAAVAAELGISDSAISQWESDETRPDRDRLLALARLYGLDVATVLGDDDGGLSKASPNVLRPVDALIRPPQVVDLPRDVPVRGTSGGRDGAFIMGTSVVDYVRRPPAIAHRLDVFGMHVVDDSMAPWRKPRELVFIEPNQTPMAGDHVVVELLGEHKENGRPAFLRALVRATSKSLRLRQYNPGREIEVERRQIAQVYRVWEWSELFAAG